MYRKYKYIFIAKKIHELLDTLIKYMKNDENFLDFIYFEHKHSIYILIKFCHKYDAR